MYSLLASVQHPESIDAATILDGLSWIRPELVLTVGLLLVILCDLVTGLKKKQNCAYLTVAILLVGLFLVVDDFLLLSGPEFSRNSITPEGLGGTLTIDTFALYMKLIFFPSALLVTIFSFRQSEVPFLGQGEYYSLILSVTLACCLLTQSQTLLMIFLSFEFISIPQYILAGSMKAEQDSVEGALKYVIYGGVASGTMLFGFSLLYGFTGGQLDLAGIQSYFAGAELTGVDRAGLTAIVLLILAGMGFKISAVPFHMWSPDVYQGTPTPIVAFFSIAPKAAGLAFMIRFFLGGLVGDPSVEIASFPVNWPMFIAILSVASMTLGNLAALWQNNIKRLLAYSSIAHAGYILIGLILITQTGLQSMLFYLMMYLIMNAGIFVSAIALIDATGEEDFTKYGGLGWRLPVIAIPMVVFLISLTGIPPTAGFVAKFVLFLEAVKAKWTWIIIIALLNTVVSLYYYANIFRYLFLRRPEPEDMIDVNKSKVLFSYKCLSILLLIATLVFGIYPTPFTKLASIASKSILVESASVSFLIPFP